MKLSTQLVLTPRFMHVVPFLGMVTALVPFFLLGSSMVLQSGIVVRLPASTSMLEPVPKAAVISLTAGRLPQIFVNDKLVADDEALVAALKASLERSRKALIRADELAAYGQVLRVSQIAQREGFDVILATDPPSQRDNAPAQ